MVAEIETHEGGLRLADENVANDTSLQDFRHSWTRNTFWLNYHLQSIKVSYR